MSDSQHQCQQHPQHDHVHGPDCGHTAIKHEDHVDYLHDGHLHHPHENHIDEHRIEISEAQKSINVPATTPIMYTVRIAAMSKYPTEITSTILSMVTCTIPMEIIAMIMDQLSGSRVPTYFLVQFLGKIRSLSLQQIGLALHKKTTVFVTSTA